MEIQLDNFSNLDHVCYICFDEGGYQLCACNSFMHLDCQKKLIEASNCLCKDDKFKCTVCKETFKNVDKKAVTVKKDDRFYYAYCWCIMTIFLPNAIVFSYYVNGVGTLFIMFCFFTCTSYVITFLHLLLYCFFKDKYFYESTYELQLVAANNIMLS